MVDDSTPDAPQEEGQSLNLSDEVQVKGRNKKLKAKAELRRRFMVGLLSERPGREWVWALLTRGHIFTTSFVNGDPMATAFKEGERNLALSVLAEIPPEAMQVMMSESGEYDV